MAWHIGHPLSQSLFTSLYLDRLLSPHPQTLEQARFGRDKMPENHNRMLHLVLRSYCLGLVKTCHYVHLKISTEHYYEVGTISVIFRLLELFSLPIHGSRLIYYRRKTL